MLVFNMNAKNKNKVWQIQAVGSSSQLFRLTLCLTIANDSVRRVLVFVSQPLVVYSAHYITRWWVQQGYFSWQTVAFYNSFWTWREGVFTLTCLLHT